MAQSTHPEALGLRAEIMRDAQEAIYYRRALGRSSDIGPITLEQQDRMVELGVIAPVQHSIETRDGGSI